MQAQRDEIADNSDDAQAAKYLDCAKCEWNASERQVNRCGWLPESQWARPNKRFPRLQPFNEAPCCPGYLIAQPEVYEAARGLAWKRDGSLRDEYDQPLTPVLRDCIDILDAACKDTEREHLRKQMRKQREMSRGPK